MNDGKLKIKHVITSCGCDYLIPLTLVLLFDIILHGHLSPGGGFQGGQQGPQDGGSSDNNGPEDVDYEEVK